MGDCAIDLMMVDIVSSRGSLNEIRYPRSGTISYYPMVGPIVE